MKKRQLAAIAGAGCLVCCIGPLTAALGSLAAAGLIDGLAAGALGLVAAFALSVLVYVAVRRSQQHQHGSLAPQRVELGATRR